MGRDYDGRFVKDAQVDDELIDDLDERGLLLRARSYEHSYPHCWRCGTPLLYYAKTSPGTSRRRGCASELLAANETVALAPAARQARALRRLAGATTSTGRSRASATGARRCRCGAARGATCTSIGSFEELQRRSGSQLEDHHRPFVDEVEFACPHEDADGETLDLQGCADASACRR